MGRKLTKDQKTVLRGIRAYIRACNAANDIYTIAPHNEHKVGNAAVALACTLQSAFRDAAWLAAKYDIEEYARCQDIWDKFESAEYLMTPDEIAKGARHAGIFNKLPPPRARRKTQRAQ